MRYKVIVNPLAGKGFAGRSIPKIESVLSGLRIQYDLVRTRWAGEAIELARQYRAMGVLTIAGGQHFVDENVAEALHKLVVFEMAVQDLDRHGATELQVPGLVDFTHASRSDEG